MDATPKLDNESRLFKNCRLPDSDLGSPCLETTPFQDLGDPYSAVVMTLASVPLAGDPHPIGIGNQLRTVQLQALQSYVLSPTKIDCIWISGAIKLNFFSPGSALPPCAAGLKPESSIRNSLYFWELRNYSQLSTGCA